MDSKNISIISLNVRGLCDHKSRRKTFAWLRDLKADIVCLQETFCTAKLQPYFDAGWKGAVYHSLTNSSHSRGVSILFRENINVKYINHHTDEDGRMLMVNFELCDLNELFSICSIYAPNDENVRVDFFKKLNKWLTTNTINENNTVVCGDFNCCLTELDRVPSSHLKDKSRTCLKNIVSACKLNDMWDSNNDIAQPRYTINQRVDWTISLCLKKPYVNL